MWHIRLRRCSITMKKFKGIYFFIFIICLSFLGCGDKEEATEKVANIKEKELLEFFNKNVEGSKIIVAKEEDINGDELKDLVVIYNKDNESQMVAVINESNREYKLSDVHKAPKENQDIQFKNIDDKDPMEFIVSGSKNGAVGYAIFRLEGDKVIDLFGDGMEDCCS